MLVKICGLTRPGDAVLAASAGADLLGFVFVPGTPRALEPSRTSWIRDLGIGETVGVFRDATLETIERVRDDLRLDWIQLHGDEPDHYLDRLGTKVIRRVPVADEIDWDRLAELSSRCLPLFDPGAGDGRAWAWEVLAERPPGLQVGLAGGLDPDNVGAAVATVRPRLVDVSSGVESAPGIKAPELVRRFVAAARSAETS